MPTVKQKAAFDKIIENRGNISKTMIEVGYTPASAQNPKNLTESKGWQELMQDKLPDEHLIKKHREFLDAPRIVRTFKKGELETEIEETDSSAVKALDMAYKLKGSYAAEKSINLNLGVDELKEVIKENLENFRTVKRGENVS